MYCLKYFQFNGEFSLYLFFHAVAQAVLEFTMKFRLACAYINPPTSASPMLGL